MSKTKDREQIISAICNAAKQYKQNLIGKKFLFIFESRSIEIVFKKDSFKHLTGVSSYLSAKQFYKKALNGTLRKEQIWFDKQHPFSLCVRKIKHISNIFQITINECFLLEDINTKTVTYQFGATNLNFTLCMTSEPNTFDFIIQSLRDEDCFDKASNVYEVVSILSKQNDQKLYSNLTYLDKRYSLCNLPNVIKQKIEPSLFLDNEDNSKY